jgi:hypothetical protein
MVCHKDLRHLPLHSERLLEISPGERESHRAINIAIGRERREEGLGWVLGQNDMKAEFDFNFVSFLSSSSFALTLN